MVLWSSINRLMVLPSTSSILIPTTTRCDDVLDGEKREQELPPQLQRIETFDEKVWRKFTSQPLVPIGCAATVYFLASGIQSFRNRNPRRSQKMMQARVAAQFVTLLCFIGYMGLDRADFRIAPMFQDVKKWEEIQKKEMQEQQQDESESKVQQPQSAK